MKIKLLQSSWLFVVVLSITVVAMCFMVAGIVEKLSQSNSRSKSKDQFYHESTCDNCWENFSGYMDHPSKCYSCEREMIRNKGEAWAWMGQKTKSFDAEQAMISRTGRPDAAYDAHPIRYY